MQSHFLLLALSISLLLTGCGKSEVTESAANSSPAAQEEDEDPGEYGPGLNQVHVVRSLTIKVSGGVSESVSGNKADGHTTLAGECKPDMFANLSFDTGSMMSDNYGVGFVTKDPITLGQTGAIDLDWVMFTANKMSNNDLTAMRFKNEDGGTLTLTTHNPARGSRRMTGTIVARNLQPLDGLDSKPVNVEASFDADFSCGVR